MRAPLRGVGPALQAGDTARAAADYAEFKGRWPSADALLQAEAAQAIGQALKMADAAMASPSIDPVAAAPLVDTLLARYNYGVNLLNAAARNADRQALVVTEPSGST